MRVAAGAIARKYLRERLGIEIFGGCVQIGSIKAEIFDWAEVHNNPFFFPDASKIGELETLIDQLRRDGSSIGARVNVYAKGVPVGLGEPVFDRLDRKSTRLNSSH